MPLPPRPSFNVPVISISLGASEVVAKCSGRSRATSNESIPFFDAGRRCSQIQLAPVFLHLPQSRGSRVLYSIDADLGDLEVLDSRVGLKSKAEQPAELLVLNLVILPEMPLFEDGQVFA